MEVYIYCSNNKLRSHTQACDQAIDAPKIHESLIVVIGYYNYNTNQSCRNDVKHKPLFIELLLFSPM